MTTGRFHQHRRDIRGSLYFERSARSVEKAVIFIIRTGVLSHTTRGFLLKPGGNNGFDSHPGMHQRQCLVSTDINLVVAKKLETLRH